jgi:putative sigma-54 modulation protein
MKDSNIAEIKITGDRLSINCREKTGDMYSSIDMALDKLEKQIKKTAMKILMEIREENDNEEEKDDN